MSRSRPRPISQTRAPSRHEPVRRPGENTPHDFEAVRAARMRKPRLGHVFGRKFGQGFGVDIGRIGENQIVAPVAERGEEIALDEGHAIGNLVLLDVAPCDLQRVGRKVDGVDPGVGKDAGGEDGERAAPRAEVEDPSDLRRVASQRIGFRERRHQELANEAARHDDPLVDVKRHALDIGAVQEVGGRLSGDDARLDQRVEPRALGAQEPGVEKGIERVDRKIEAFENDEGRFVERCRRPVAERQVLGAEAANRVTQPVARGGEKRDALIAPAVRLRLGRLAFAATGLGPRAGRKLTRRACTHA